MSYTDHHVEPIRPGGGLRRLRQGDLKKRPETTTTLLNRTQFRTVLQTEIERAIQDELTMLVMRTRIRALPGGSDDGLNGRELPQELLDRIRNCNENLRVVVVGPDELMMMVPSLRRRPDGEALVAAVLEALTPPLSIDGLPHHLSPMVGAAMLDPENPSSDLLVDGARLALEECDGLHAGMMFHPYQRVRHDRRREMEVDVRAAVLAGEITCALQPAFNIESGRLVALEAFARWDRTGKGPVPAVEFVHMADEVGVGHLLGQQVLTKSLTLLDDLMARATVDDGVVTPIRPDLVEDAAKSATPDKVTLWLNVSPDEVLHPEFISTITNAIRSTDRIQVGLELSPSPPGDARDIHQRLKTLVAKGARVAIGDFGIGNANLTMLQQLPFDAVKLDRALIRQIAGNAAAADLVGALVDMATLLKLETTAQGVENQAQLDVVTDLGCELGQGYFYAEPTSDPQTISSWFTV